MADLDPRPGDLLNSAALFRAVLEAASGGARVALGGQLYGRTGFGGQAIAAYSDLEFWARITAKSGTGTSTRYSWTETLELSGGTWADGTRSGTASADQAREVNDNESVPVAGTTRVRMWIGADGTPEFQYGACS